MQLAWVDWLVVVAYGLLALVVGLLFVRRAGEGRESYFLSGRSLPWWLLGTSMVATTFSTDTPNLVTDMVRTGGVSQNWLWWAFVLTGMLTVFFYARLWRRSEVLTDVGFYEIRYSGKPAAFLRGFRALYLGVFFNVMIMATVTLAAIKISGVLLGLSPVTAVILAGTITVIYSATSGLWGVVVTDLLLFVLAMAGAIAAAYYAVTLPQVGGLSGLFSNPALHGKLSLLPDFSDTTAVLTVLIVPLAVQWWATWYPGAEPGGGGYIAQRMLAARNEKESLYSVLWFNVAHYGLRPWPWILVALASIIVYPDLASIHAAFPNLDPSIVRNDLAYPAMLVFLPHGLMGLMLASLAAAYMSTISTHLNWGASYVTDDVYRRFIAPDVDERHYVTVARITTVGLIILACLVALWLQNALQAFQILLQIGAGTGLIFLLRWYWWRINAWGEVAAMVVSFLVAIYFQFVHGWLGFSPVHPTTALVLGVLITTTGWLVVTLLTRPTDPAKLQSFYDLTHPAPAGWRKAVDVEGRGGDTRLGQAALSWFLGCIAVYGAVFGVGYLLYGRPAVGLPCLAVTALAAWALGRLLARERFVS
ncbi:MAG TPA: sodium:solute symporter family protein [Longimicrobiales bacterium]|nr:sodium:solute symporter family protein [Longimicrobiales bacterium]